MSTCPFPNHYRADSDDICTSSTCPIREDCPGVDPEPVEDEDPAIIQVLDGMQAQLNALTRQLSDLKAALGRWVEGVEGGDRGRD